MPALRPSPARALSCLALAVTLASIFEVRLAGAALPPGKTHVETLAPAEGAVAPERELTFAWTPAERAARHYLLISRRPFETRGRLALPTEGAIEVRELSHPVARFEDLGWALGEETRIYWAGASVDPKSGKVWLGDVRTARVLPRFSNTVAASPYLETSPVAKSAPVVSVAGDRIRLAAGYEVDPRAGEPRMPEALRTPMADDGATRAWLLYYGDADPERVRASILASGGTIVAYVPDHTFLVRARGAARNALESAASWSGLFQPAYKLSPTLELESTLARPVNVLVFPDGDLGAVRRGIEARGGTVDEASANGINNILRATLPGTALAALAQDPDVLWIEPHVPLELLNDNVQWVVQTNAGAGASGNRRLWDLGLHGEGEIVSTCDSGVEPSHDFFRDPSVPLTTFGDYPTHRKIIGYKRGADSPGIAFGDQSSASYHGTHTAGTFVGNDDATFTTANQAYDGVAKAAKLYFMDLSGPSLGTGLETFPDLNDLYTPPYTGNAGGAARVSSNSWGSAVNGLYDVNAMAVDQFMWNHPDFLLLFANGNSGAMGTVSSPATAKSVVSVGGTRNGGNANRIYNATSRGPAADGRRKPTICTPGESVRSASFAPSNTQVLSGTSMATPGAAASATLLRQYCREGWYPTGAKVAGNGFLPSAALLKAMLVNSAVSDFHVLSPSIRAPDMNVGYGRVNCDSVLYFAGDARKLLLVDMSRGLGNGEHIEYQVNVTDPSIPLKVALCWTDYPGSPAAGRELVNNLDLTVTNGTVTYHGNSFTTGIANTDPAADSLNTEELVSITPTPGLWTVRIDGASVALGPQPFGLVITGGLAAGSGALALDRATYGSGSTVALRVVDGNAGATVSVRVASTTEPSGEIVTLTGAAGVYTGTIPLSPFLGDSGDATLQVSNGDVLTATYVDASPAATLTATARVSIETPLVTGVHATSAGSNAVQILWRTDRSASSRVYYGATPALGSSSAFDPTAVLDHSVTLTGLVAGQTYFYDVESQDLTGAVTRDDNGGAHYRVTVRPVGDLLVVYSPDYENAARYESALERLGWDFDTWRNDASDHPQVGNALGGMRSYQAVWWQVGLESYPPFTDAARDSLTQYMNGGGRLAVVGHDITWSLQSLESEFFTQARSDWVSNTLHSSFINDTPTWPAITGVPGDPISGAYGSLPYREHRVGASGDEVGVVNGAGAGTGDWLSSDGSPDTCGLRWESAAVLGTPGSGVWAGQKSRLAAMYFEWSEIDPDSASSITRDGIARKTLEWLTGRAKPLVTVVAPNGGSTESGATVSIQWTETVAPGFTVSTRTLEYSTDGGESWSTIATGAGPSPYTWNLAGVPNTLEALVRVRVADSGPAALAGSDVSDATFKIQHAAGDVAGPAVLAGTVRVNPNPIDATQTSTVSATVSDSTSGGSAVAAAEWSLGATPAAAGTGHAMTGAFGTVQVAVSATIPASTLPHGAQSIHVRARDAAGNWGNARALGVWINDSSTPALLALFQTEPLVDGVEVRWRFGAGAPFVGADLERAANLEGPWMAVAAEPRLEAGMIVVTDRGVPAGSTVWYRLEARTASGERTTFGPISAAAGHPIRDFELISVKPNPAAGPMRIAFGVPTAAPVRLSVMDVQGREVALLADGIHSPGRYEATWSGEGNRGAAPVGVYFLVFRSPRKSEVRRVVLAR